MLKEFYDLCKRLNISPSSYDDFDIRELDDSKIKMIEQLNIYEMLEDELKKDTVDLGFIKFLLNNLARFDNTDVADLILQSKNYIKIFPILRSFINYLIKVRSFDETHKHEIGKKVIDLFENSFSTELQFNRMWLLHLFSESDEWNNKEFFMEIYRKYDDDLTRREIVQSLGKSKNYDFFRECRMVNLGSMNPWLSRSFITGFSCLPKDERTALYNSRKYMQRDYLDKIVDEWVKKNVY
jgi:hypothetical protein